MEAIAELELNPSYNNNEFILLACRTSQPQAAIQLLKHPRANPCVNYGCILGEAASRGYTDVVKEILKNHDVDPSVNGNVAMNYACKADQVEIVKVLLADPRYDHKAGNFSAIDVAYRNNSYNVVKILLKDSRLVPDYKLRDLMFDAIKHANSEMLELFLDNRDVDRNTRKKLLEAVMEKELNMEEKIMQYPFEHASVARCDPSVGNNQAIRLAVAHGRADILELLLEKSKSDPRINPTVNNSEILRMAVDTAKADIVKLLLDYEGPHGKLDVNACDGYALNKAVSIGNTEIVEMLLNC